MRGLALCRYSENYFVTTPGYKLRFYAAAPLIAANGHRVGTLWVLGGGGAVLYTVSALTHIADALCHLLMCMLAPMAYSG